MNMCPDAYGLPPVNCGTACIGCYANNEVPTEMAESLFMEPVDVKDLIRIMGGVS